MAAGNASTSTAANTAERELVFMRVFDAPRELVFEAWTHPEHVTQWWGPNGFTTTIHEMDVRPGGVWRLVMHGPDGVDYKNRIVFLEVVSPERLVYRHVPDKDTEPVNFQVTVTFAEKGDKTELTMRMLFPSVAARDHVVKKYGAIEGANQTLQRLGGHLARMAEGNSFIVEPGKPTFVITRVFNAPRRRVFEAWTRCEHLARWWGPRGYTLRDCEIDLRPGGAYRLVHRAPDGQEYGLRGVYREVVPPEWLVYTFEFEGMAGHEAVITLAFDEQGGKTKLTNTTLHQTVEDRDAHLETGKDGMIETLDRLAEHLGAMK